MARNSKRPINFSDGVTAQVNGRLVTFTGKKGSMDLNVHSEVNVETNEEFRAQSEIVSSFDLDDFYEGIKKL